jgi:enoyl-CoA hydratase
VSPAVHLQRASTAGGAATLRLDAPPANLLDDEVVAGLEAAASSLQAEPPAGLVFTGGPRAFSAGVDPGALVGPGPSHGPDEERARALVVRLGALLGRLESLPFPTAAALEGLALGGGLELALATDVRVAGDTCRLGLPEAHLGVLPAGGATQRLPRLVGRSRALELVASGRTVRPAEAQRLGLVDRVVPRGQALAEAVAVVEALAQAEPARRQLVRSLGTGRAVPSEH